MKCTVKPVPLVCFGDSITQGANIPDAKRWTSILERLLRKRFGQQFSVHNRGIGGNTTALALDRINQDVLPLLPGVVLLEFGFNDAYVLPWTKCARVSLSEYRRNIRELVRILQSNKAQVILVRNHLHQCNHFQGNQKSFNENYEQYDLALNAFAEKSGLNKINLPELMRKKGVSVEMLVDNDGLHLSAEGNRRYAEMIFDGLMKIRGNTENDI